MSKLFKYFGINVAKGEYLFREAMRPTPSILYTRER
jgi:hypothetical protein